MDSGLARTEELAHAREGKGNGGAAGRKKERRLTAWKSSAVACAWHARRRGKRRGVGSRPRQLGRCQSGAWLSREIVQTSEDRLRQADPGKASKVKPTSVCRTGRLKLGRLLHGSRKGRNRKQHKGGTSRKHARAPTRR